MRVLTRPVLGGPTRQAAALWHAHRDQGIATLLVVGVCGADEASLCLSDLPQLTPEDVAHLGKDAEGCVVVPALRRRVAPVADLSATRVLRRLMADFRPDVVHTHTSKAGVLGRRAAFRERVPVVAHTFHGHVLADYFGRTASVLLRALERRLARRTDCLWAVSPSCAAELEALGIAAPGAIAVAPPALPLCLAPDSARADARRRLGIDDAQWIAACAGRLVPIKRVDLFLQAVERHADLRGDVYGDGPQAARLRAAAGPRIRFKGADPDLARALPAYDALVIPSAREGCPLVALEAFAAGIPVVGFDVPGVRDALGDWGGGVLVPSAAGPPGLADALAELRADPALSTACVADGRAGLERFAPDRVAAGLAEGYAAAGAGLRP